MCSRLTKRSGKVGKYLSVLNCASENGVVVRDVRTRVASGDAEVREQQPDGLGGHRGASIGVQGELVVLDVLDLAALGDAFFGEESVFAGRDGQIGRAHV